VSLALEPESYQDDGFQAFSFPALLIERPFIAKH
jgi:hypothetical protein